MGWPNNFVQGVYDETGKVVGIDDGGGNSIPLTVAASSFTSLTAALDYAASNAVELLVDGDYALTDGYTTTSPLMLNITGKIRTGTTKGIQVFLPPLQVDTVTSISNVRWPTATGIESVTRLTVSDGTKFSRNDFCQLRSLDEYFPVIGGVKRKGEGVRVSEVVGNEVYLSGVISDTYTTGVQLVKLNKGVINIRTTGNGVMTFDGDPYSISSKTKFAAIEISGAVRPTVDIKVENDIADAVRLYTCANYHVKAAISNLRNNDGQGVFGYGVSAYGSCFSGYAEVYASNVRHAFTTGIWASNIMEGLQIRDGRAVDCVVSGIATDCSYAAWDSHEQSVNTIFLNCGVVHTTSTTVDNNSNANAYAFQLRGINEKIINAWTKGVRSLFVFKSPVTDYIGITNTTEVIGGIFERAPEINQSAFANVPTKTSSNPVKIVIKGATFKGYIPNQNANSNILSFEDVNFDMTGYTTSNAIFNPDNNGGFDFLNVKFINFPNIRWGQGNTSKLIDCKRINTIGSNIEPMSFGAGSNFTMHNYYADAPSYGLGCILSVGTATITTPVVCNIGDIYGKGTIATPLRKADAGTIVTLNLMKRTPSVAGDFV